ncbi:YceD family protein [Sphingomonas aracearum]|uniref:DUF177 domain-containing protein n=1 Tax=Sphingomonas aracearum TaxID=2283317 RepID=A0A369VQN8_9SPHN|nr:DUF177 domain-containing protein [Sphingomonas aracearum]RDE04708.1 DUF177 domain-containing protein [Sphingomonas aracearum]
MTDPEFSRPQRLDTIGDSERTVEIAADEAERQALARRFGLRSVDRLEARFAVRRDAGGVAARGHVSARVVQACTVTGDPLPASVEEDVLLRFVAAGDGSEEEVELGEDALDTMEFTGGAIDLGEAAAETMALGLDPYPRGADAEEKLRAAGVKSEEEAGPFGALAGLKDALNRKG